MLLGSGFALTLGGDDHRPREGAAATATPTPGAPPMATRPVLAESVAGPPATVPQERIGTKRVVLGDYPDRPWLSYYRAHKSWLGDPQWGERPFGVQANCVGFTYYIVCQSADPRLKGSTWEFLPLLLGEQQMPHGATRQLDAPLAPAVHAYIARLLATGEDWQYWLGRVVSPAYCPADPDAAGGSCFQVFQRQILRWSADSQDPADVRLSPLGAEYTQ
jgi:hypothetical protein